MQVRTGVTYAPPSKYKHTKSLSSSTSLINTEQNRSTETVKPARPPNLPPHNLYTSRPTDLKAPQRNGRGHLVSRHPRGPPTLASQRPCLRLQRPQGS